MKAEKMQDRCHQEKILKDKKITKNLKQLK
jgi:hypothetical protein